jgi:hypothetical protein
MPELVLHHYPGSPYAEKIRLILGYKRLAWGSVEIPEVMPRPQLMPLTGGYRRSPVLQVGGDVVRGHLVSLRPDAISILRRDPAVGSIVNHFPRIGFRVLGAEPPSLAA